MMTSHASVRSWATATSTHAANGRVVIFRYAKEFASGFDKAARPNRIIIAWRYHSDSGQPVPEEHQRMAELEDALEDVLDSDEFAILALVSTGENLREWTYYVRSEEEFMTRLNRALADKPAFPIEIHTASDAGWEMYEKFKAGVRE